MNPWEEYAAPAAGPWDDYAGPVAAVPEQAPNALGSDMENFVAGVGRGAKRVGYGVKGALDLAASGLANTPIGGMVDQAGQALGMPGADQAGQATAGQLAEDERLEGPLLATSAGKVGSAFGTLTAALPTLFIPGVNSAVGATVAGAAQGALLEPGTVDERMQGGARGAVLGLGGYGIGKGLAAGARALVGRMAQKMSPQVAAVSANARAAQDAGYVLPPATTNPTWLNRITEGFAGKVTTAQQASMRNQSVTNRLARESLGLAEDAPITPQMLQSVRREAGQAYQALEEIPITADVEYGKALMGLTSRQSKAAQAFPGAGPDPLAAQVQSLWSPEFTGGQALAKISLLREQAKAAFKNDPSLARGLNGAADALEDVIDRNLQASGAPELLGQYRLARAQIARAYTVERALNPATGNVSARELGKQLAKGKPLSGGLREAGQAGLAFPKATADIAESMPGVSPLDFAVGGLSAASGSPAGFGLLFGRPIVRNALLSSPYQAGFVVPNRLAEASASALQRPIVRNALGFAAANSAIQE